MESSRRHQISSIRYKVLYCSWCCKRHLHQFLLLPPPPPAHPNPTGGMQDSPGMLCPQLWVTAGKHWAHLPTPCPEGMLPSHTGQWTTRPLTAGNSVSIFPCSRLHTVPSKDSPQGKLPGPPFPRLANPWETQGTPPPNNERATMPTLTLPSSEDSF